MLDRVCGRYVSPSDYAMEQLFNALRINPFSETDRARYRPSFNVAPTQLVPCVRVHEGRREALLMRWGLIPNFARGEPGKYSTINARIETMTTSPAYRSAWKRGQRCLMLAAGFYEWQTRGSARQPFYIHCADQDVFAFAGIWDSSTKPDGETILSCTIVTMPASPMMAEIHNTKHREPSILAHEAIETWLTGTPAEALSLLKPYRDDLRIAWEVSTRVNSPRNNGEALIEPMHAAS